jgi:protein-S-isoprenylcysteine O-methyltransferase Ste14
VNVYIALSLVIFGTLLVLTSLIFLRQAFTVTPQARFLVTSGPYPIVRHPMYVGNIISLLGLALLIDSGQAIALFIICAALQIRRALYEERLLRSTFQEYADYQTRSVNFVRGLSCGL